VQRLRRLDCQNKKIAMKYTVISLIACITFSGCNKEKVCNCVMPYQIYYLKAKVIQTSDISCNMPVLDFSEDSLRIRSLTNLDNLIYTISNLQSNYIIQNQKLYVSIVSLKPNEEFPCNTIGILLPRLKVVDAKKRE
jgi:hypothetical protein